MQATHVSRSRIARQMTSKERWVGQKSRRAREMQALGARSLSYIPPSRPSAGRPTQTLSKTKRYT